MYEHGQGTSVDLIKAKKLYLDAGKLGLSDAYVRLADMFMKQKRPSALDYSQAIDYYVKAAELNNGKACENLGKIYRHGKGVLVDFAKAHKYFQQAADLEYPEGYNSLAWLYRNGIECWILSHF